GGVLHGGRRREIREALRQVDAPVHRVQARHLADHRLSEALGAPREDPLRGPHQYPASRFTTLSSGSPVLKRRRFSSMSATVRWRTLGDEFEECGVMITLSSDQSGLSRGSGSTVSASSAAPPISPASSASARAASSTIAPRAMFTIHAVDFMRAMTARETAPRVACVSGAHTAR